MAIVREQSASDQSILLAFNCPAKLIVSATDNTFYEAIGAELTPVVVLEMVMCLRVLVLTSLLFSSFAWTDEGAGTAPVASLLDSYRDAAVKKWEKEILKLEQRDQQQPDPENALLFIGSSSIRRWDSIASDMKPYPVIQRGYGGAKFSDVAIYAERLITPHKYRGLVIFVGNDVQGKESDKTPEEFEKLVRYVVNVSLRHQPKRPVFLIEITPTAKRFAAWPTIRKANARLREVALSTPHTYFVATASHYLTAEGNPKDELFVDDKLHLNAAGYRLWASLIRRRLEDVFLAP